MAQTKKIAVILSGCGFLDGAEIREAVLALHAIDSEGADFQCFAPDKQIDEVDHLTKKPTGQKRSLLREAARIARGKIQPVTELSSKNFDALILPGGFGAAKNLCSFADQGPDCSIDPNVGKAVEDFISSKKPIGAICIAPALIAKAFQKHGGVKLTIGDDAATAAALEKMGAKHSKAAANEIVVDSDRHVATTPAYMYDSARLKDIGEGIRKLVHQVVAWA